MNVTKLTISQETREKLNNPVLTPMKKRELREEMIKDSIRSAVGGVRTKQELVAAAGYNPDAKSSNYASGIGHIGSMVKRGIISHNNTNAFRKTWVVCEDVKTKAVENKSQMPVPIIPKDIMVIREEPTDVDRVKLIDMAKQWAWDNNSDSLRDFIAHAQNTLK